MSNTAPKSEDPQGATAKLFRNGRSQAVRLPKEFRFEGDAVRIRKVEGGVLLEPVLGAEDLKRSRERDLDLWFAQLAEWNKQEEFMPEGREQPRMPEREFGF
jgi:antitoxin VapB